MPAETLLDEYRKSIDNLDAALISLLAERFKVTRKVGLYKAEHGLPGRDPEREHRQMVKIEGLSQAAGLKPETAKAVLRVIIDQVVEEHHEVRRLVDPI